jgi:hypothetical protein
MCGACTCMHHLSMMHYHPTCRHRWICIIFPQVYEVAIRQCENDIIDLGYHKLDFIQDSIVPCGGRPEPEGCHYIEIFILDQKVEKSFLVRKELPLNAGLYERCRCVMVVPP